MRTYTIPFHQMALAVTSLGDIAGFETAASLYAELLEIVIDEADSAIANGFDLDLVVRQYYNGTITRGAGSATLTPIRDDLGDKPAQSTCWIGPSTAFATITGSGSGSYDHRYKSFHIYQGFAKKFEPGEMPLSAGNAFVVGLMTNPAYAVKIDGYVRFGERGAVVPAT